MWLMMLRARRKSFLARGLVAGTAWVALVVARVAAGVWEAEEDGMWLVSVAVSPLSLLCALQVSISHTVTHSDQQSLEIDNYLDSSILDSSFPTFPGLQAEVSAPLPAAGQAPGGVGSG